MKLQYYNCKVCSNASGTQERFQIQFVVPHFESFSEYLEYKETYESAYGSDEQRGVFNFESGTINPAFQFVIDTYKMTNLLIPSIPNPLCYNYPYNTLNSVLGFHKYNVSFRGLPVTETTDVFIFRDFYIKNNGNVYGPFTFSEYKNEEDKYEPYGASNILAIYGSGDGSNNPNEMYFQIPVYFVAGDSVYLSQINGYVHDTPLFGWRNSIEVFPSSPTINEFTRMLLNGSHSDYSGDPLDPGGTSATGGGDGDFTSEELNLDFPDDPALSTVGTGMVSLFSPTTAQLQSLANYLWSTDFDLDLFKKMFAAPLDAILGLSIVPVAVPTSGAVQLKFGGWPTTVSMNKTNKQWVTVDCGSVEVRKYWGSALDYNPYTKVSIFLPYIGDRDLDTDEVMGKTLSVQYKVDILSGACVAMIKCSGAVLYQFAGSCAVQIPISNRDWSSVIGAAVSIGAGAVAAAATGGASAVGTTAVALNSANAVMSAKVKVSHSGAVGGSAGFMGIQNPYILIKRARQSLPAQFNRFEGYPSNITDKIKNLAGFTQIEKIHLENIPATSAEIDELETILKEGIII